MGFLDFLKKDKPQPAPAPAPSLDLRPTETQWPADLSGSPAPMVSTPAPSAWTMPPQAAPVAQPPMPPPPAPSVAASQPAVPPMPPLPAASPFAASTPAAPLSAPAASPATPPPAATLTFSSSDSHDQWLPPPPKPDGFQLPKTQSMPVPGAVAASDLPDFTDDDLSPFKKPAQPAPQQPPAPLQPPAMPEPEPKAQPKPELPPLPQVKITTEEPLVPAPANAIALKADDILLPIGEEVRQAEIEPTRFLSSAQYLSILADTRAMRKALRQSDDVIKDATLRHEQLDQQYKRVAAEVNAIQEHFIGIDSALFDEVQ